MLAYLKAHVAWCSALVVGFVAANHYLGVVSDPTISVLLLAMSAAGLYVAPSPVFAPPPEKAP